MSRKICVITGSRAEYGLLKPLMDEIRSQRELTLQLIVTGMHLSSKFGLTYRQIEKDGFIIDEKVEVILSSDSAAGISKSIGLGIISFAEVFERLSPDMIVVLGDKYEIFGPVIVALMNRIPVAHIHGGEVTQGAFDDSIRHCLTKMSFLHFTSTEEYRRRVIQLGENPQRVFNVGALGLDNIKRLKLLSKKELEKELNFQFNKRNLLATFHPVTLEDEDVAKQFQNLLEVLDEQEDTNIIFTKANADPGGKTINQLIDEYVSKNPDKSVSFTSMGQVRYLSTMQFVDAIIGNSSSGIIEAPSFRIGTVNIGDRQKGRLKAKSVIDCDFTKESIKNAIGKLYSAAFQKTLKSTTNQYGDGNTASRIVRILKDYDITVTNIMKKAFYNVDFTLQEF